MLIAWMTAIAGVPVTVPVAAGTLREAVPFRLETPAPYRHSASPREAREGWWVVLEVDPAWQVPHPIATPVLWVGEQAAVRVNWRSACAVAWVPGPTDPRTVPVYYGGATLPERLTAAAGRAWLQRAREARIPVQHVPSEEPRRFAGFTELMRHLEERASACAEVRATSP